MIKRLTLCFLLKENEILLAMKKRGFGVGKWNGVGGKVQENETPMQAAIRETEEEIGVTPQGMKRVGILYFHFLDKKCVEKDINRVFVYTAKKWSGTLQETEEMRPQWFDFSEIPYNEMWEDDVYWLPKLLQGEKVEGRYVFDSNHRLLLEQ